MSPVIGTCNIIRTRASGVILRLQMVTAICLSVALLGTSAAAPARRSSGLDVVRIFNIPALPLDKALLQFGAQAHVQLSVSLDLTKASHITRALNGAYTGQQALADLLVGTGLKYAVHGLTVEIRRSELVRDAKPSPSGSKTHASSQQVNSVQHLDPPKNTADRASENDEREMGRLLEIIVTAQKYRQRAFDVPLSLDVISGAEMRQRGITNLSELQYNVPGLYMNSTGISHAVYLRGVGNSNGNGAMVGQYIDDADITAEDTSGESGVATGDSGLYDLSRVEVLKGPQGTLYGDGSMGGVIRYITNRPVLSRFRMSTNVAESFTQYGSPSQRVEAVLNTPVVPQIFGLRFASMFKHDGGWVDEPAANLKNINDSNLVDMRAEALWRPTARVKVNAMQILHRHASGLGTGEDASGNITPLFGTTLVPHQTDSSNISNITITYDFAGAQLLSSSTYYSETQDIYDLFSTIGNGPVTFWELIPNYNYHNEDYSEEVRLEDAGEGAWHWTIGSFYKHFRDELFYPEAHFGLAGSSLTSAFRLPGVGERNVSSSIAGFVDTSYRFFKRLTLGAGARYYDDREMTPPFPTEKFTSVDPRLYVQYRLTPDVNSYISASKGFRSGGANVPPEPPFRPETLWSYDLGTKIRVPGRGLAVDFDVFDMNYSNYTTVVYVPPVYETGNVGSARIRGIDADLTWQLMGGWRVGMNTEVLQTEFLTTSAISGYTPGDRLPYAPTYSFTASIARDFRWDGRRGVVEVYGYQISRVQDRQAGAPLAQSDVLRFLNVRAAVDWNAHLKFQLFAQNLLNDRGIESPQYSFTGSSVRPRPRTIGVEFDLGFGSR